MVACDKNDGRDVWSGSRDSFGGNHGDDGGHVLKLDGSATWYNTGTWENSSSRDEILGGVTLGTSQYPNNLVGR